MWTSISLIKCLRLVTSMWVKFHPYKQQSVATKLDYKFAKRFYGPFLIVQRFGGQWFISFPFLLLARFILFFMSHFSSNTKSQFLQRHSFSGSDRQTLQPIPHALINERIVTIDDVSHYHVLVEWQEANKEEVTWEAWDALAKLYTAQALKDMVLFHQGVLLELQGLKYFSAL